MSNPSSAPVNNLPLTAINSRRVGALIVAAGSSQRMGKVNKIFVSLGGKPILAWSVDTCQRHDLVQQIVLVLNSKDLERGQKLREERGWSKVTLCPGGARRQDSVREGLGKLKNCDWVMIHDGARPFLTRDLIENGLKQAFEIGAAIAAVPVKDTIKLVNGEGFISGPFQREKLFVAQTPQIFKFDIISKAHDVIAANQGGSEREAKQSQEEEFTDDAALLERLGYRVKFYMGTYNNIKVTTPEDLALAEIIANSPSLQP